MEIWEEYLSPLVEAGRTARIETAPGRRVWFAAERLPLLKALFPRGDPQPPLKDPAAGAGESWEREGALVELLRGRLDGLGPVTAADLGDPLGLNEREVAVALLALEREGFVLRGRFSGGTDTEYCQRRLLARIQRYTLDRLRQAIEPVSAADFMRFLFVWQRVAPLEQVEGPGGVAALVELLDVSNPIAIAARSL